MKQLSNNEFDEKYVGPLEDFVFHYVTEVSDEDLHEFANLLGLENIRDMIRTMLIDAFLPEGALPKYSGNPFKTMFLQLVLEYSKANDQVLKGQNKKVFHELQRATVLFVFNIEKDIERLKKFLTVVEKADFQDPVFNQSFARDLRALIEQKA